MPNDTIVEAERKRQAAVEALAKAQAREATIKRRLGIAAAENLETSAIRKDLADVRDDIEALTASLAAHDENIQRAQHDADAAKREPLVQQLEAVLAERRKTAEECQLLGQDFVAAVAKLAHLGAQTANLAHQLGRPNASASSNFHTLPMWLCALIVPVSPGGAQQWPGVAHPAYATRGIVELDAECMERGGVA